MDELVKACDFCGKNIGSRFLWHLKLTYGNWGGFGAREICVDCAVEHFKMSREKVLFFQELCDFRRENGVNRGYYTDGDKPWSKKMVGLFATRLKNKGIPVLDYGVPLYRINVKGGSWNEYKDVFLHDLLGKKEGLVDKGQEKIQAEVDEEIYGELEKNHDAFLSLIGVDVKKVKK